MSMVNIKSDKAARCASVGLHQAASGKTLIHFLTAGGGKNNAVGSRKNVADASQREPQVAGHVEKEDPAEPDRR